MPNNLQLMLRRGNHATAHYFMEYHHDIHGLDVSRWGEWPEWSKRTASPCEPHSWLEAHKTWMRESFSYHDLGRNM
jgi:hypothetical protein